MIGALARLPLARITRTRRGWIPILGWSALAIAAAILSRATGRVGGATHVLLGTFGYVVLPLLTYGIVSATFGGAGLRASIRGLVALGAEPPRAAFASVLVAMFSSAAIGGLLAAVICLVAHGRGDPPLASDLPASFGVAFIAGATYAAYFSAGSAIGRGAMRATFLALDWLLGVSGGFGAIFVPRGHLTSLLGGQAAFELSRRVSSVLLFVLLAVYLAIAVGLGRRSR